MECSGKAVETTGSWKSFKMSGTEKELNRPEGREDCRMLEEQNRGKEHGYGCLGGVCV